MNPFPWHQVNPVKESTTGWEVLAAKEAPWCNGTADLDRSICLLSRIAGCALV